ncbi:MAG TPA: tRNA 2-thiouridine(34) synthase MnmA [Candidatus Acetothermia bacterium]|nr:tRNA 2-thiouridine(34) synthase MnmA [Candidatus Acetothermia bacterium]
MKRTALVGLSGGVDSTVAAHLLKEDGYEVHGLTLWLWDSRGSENPCCSVDGAALAARELGIPHEVVPAEREFRALVVEPALNAYRRGLTPNPCTVCNRVVRFSLLLREADRRGIEFVATGHHARVRRTAGRAHLLRGADPVKDQSYFLYALGQRELARALFPVGEKTKRDIRSLAASLGLTAAQRRESQDLCFAPAGVPALIADARPGPILDLSGREVGEHRGLPHYTIGQRRGLGLPSPEPLYVVALDGTRNAVIVGPERALYSEELVAGELAWIAGRPPGGRFSAEVQVRYRGAAIPAEVKAAGETAQVRFSQPMRAITPGQAAVIYGGEEVLGGGTIVRATSGSLR